MSQVRAGTIQNARATTSPGERTIRWCTSPMPRLMLLGLERFYQQKPSGSSRRAAGFSTSTSVDFAVSCAADLPEKTPARPYRPSMACFFHSPTIVLVNAMLGRQLRRGQLSTQRLKRHLRLEFSRVSLPLAPHIVRPSETNQTQPPVGKSGTIS
jgi:hypothetical protein